MADYEKMYYLLCGAVSDSLDILSREYDTSSINFIQILLKMAMLKAEHIYIITEDNKCGN